MQKEEALMALDRVSGLTVIDLHGGGHLCVAIGVKVLKGERRVSHLALVCVYVHVYVPFSL